MLSSKQLIRLSCHLRCCQIRFLKKQVSRTSNALLCKKNYCSEAILPPNPEGVEKNYPEKIKQIVTDISKLTLIEVSDLNELLKKTLNIQDTPMMAMGAMPAAAAAPTEEEEVASTKKEKTSFSVKLTKFDDSKKIQLIKEIKNLISGMNLVQAKKFVESVPQEVKGDLGKDEAEKLKEAIEAVGGQVEIE